MVLQYLTYTTIASLIGHTVDALCSVSKGFEAWNFIKTPVSWGEMEYSTISHSSVHLLYLSRDAWVDSRMFYHLPSEAWFVKKSVTTPTILHKTFSGLAKTHFSALIHTMSDGMTGRLVSVCDVWIIRSRHNNVPQIRNSQSSSVTLSD